MRKYLQEFLVRAGEQEAGEKETPVTAQMAG